MIFGILSLLLCNFTLFFADFYTPISFLCFLLSGFPTASPTPAPTHPASRVQTRAFCQLKGSRHPPPLRPGGAPGCRRPPTIPGFEGFGRCSSLDSETVVSCAKKEKGYDTYVYIYICVRANIIIVYTKLSFRRHFLQKE